MNPLTLLFRGYSAEPPPKDFSMLPFIRSSFNKGCATFTCLLMVALISGCTNLAPPAMESKNWITQRDQLLDLESWQMRGRVNIRYNSESHTPRIQWQHEDRDYKIRLWGTFNVGNTTLVGQPGFVTMEQDGRVLNAQSPEDLILQQLGYELPVSYLEFWIKGLPAPNSLADLDFNQLNQLITINQDGWTVNYTDPRQYGSISLPRRIEITRPINDIRLRFIGLSWTLDNSIN